MAKKVIIKDNITGEEQYPVTSSECVIGLEELAGKTLLFNDLWNDACRQKTLVFGKYDPENAPDKSKPYYLNELWLTYEEAVEIYNMGRVHNNPNAFYYDTLIRTNLPRTHSTVVVSLNMTFKGCANLEVAAIRSGIAGPESFRNCPKLRQVGTKICGFDDITVGSSNGGALTFSNCPNLEMIYGFIRYNYDVQVPDCPKLTLENFRYWLKNSKNTSSVTIHVHQDIYNALTGEATYPFNGGTQEEWEQILTDASNQQISFATT